jgi:hypothetical protein
VSAPSSTTKFSWVLKLFTHVILSSNTPVTEISAVKKLTQTLSLTTAGKFAAGVFVPGIAPLTLIHLEIDGIKYDCPQISYSKYDTYPHFSNALPAFASYITW